MSRKQAKKAIQLKTQFSKRKGKKIQMAELSTQKAEQRVTEDNLQRVSVSPNQRTGDVYTVAMDLLCCVSHFSPF